MAYIAHQHIGISGIRVSAGPTDPRLLNASERELHMAYRGNLEAAKALGNITCGLYQDAWLSLNLSVECFFKHMYCLTRPELERHSTPTRRQTLGPLEYDGGLLYYHKSLKDGSHVGLKDFGHEVLELWTFFDRFTDAHASIDFKNLKNFIPTQSDWIAARYQRRNHAARQASFHNYLLQFETTLANVFGGHS